MARVTPCVRALRWTAVLGALLVATLAAAPKRAPATPPRLVDLHVDLSYQHTYKGRAFAEATGQYRASALQAAGVAGVVLPLFVPRDVSPSGPRLSDLETSYQNLTAALARTPPYSAPGCASPSSGVRTFLAFEGAAPLAGHPELVDVWVKRGVRVFGFVHTEDNALASSAGKGPAFPRPSHGLTTQGKALAVEVLRAGAVLDLSHASDAAASDMLDLAAAHAGVVVATHSNARAIAHHPRNVSDDLVRRIAGTGGVVGVNFHSPFLRRDGAQAAVSDVVAHVVHLVSLVGPRHVAIGSDFEGGIAPVIGLARVEQVGTLARALRDAGLSDDDVKLIFSENALRVLCPGTCAP